AYRVGLYGRKYQWIIVGVYDDNWWINAGKHTTCDQSQLLEALEGYIATDVLPLSTDDRITVSGLTPAEYEAQYNKARRGQYSRFHGYAYDGIWAIALAIQKVRQKLLSKESSRSFEMFEYKDPTWVHLFREAFNRTAFIGVTGPISFTRNERRGLVLLKQFQSDTDPPMDRTLIVIERTRISVTVYSLLATFSILGILLASVFLIVNIRYRNQRNIKMSSPYLNNLIIVGCMLTYTSVILLGMDSGLTSEKNFPYICAAIKDYKLFMVVGVLMMIDVAILTTWQIIDPFYRRTSLGPPMPSPKKKDVVIIPEMEFCQSEKMTIFLGSTYAYKGLLMAFGCFLAWETRHVSIPALNDSKYVGMSVYNVVIMCVVGAAISFVLRDKQDAAFIIISVFIIFCSTTTLCLVFVPKLVDLRRNTDAGDKRARATMKPFKSSDRGFDDEVHNRIKALENQVYRQKQILNEKSTELQGLMLELKEMKEPLVMTKYPMTSIPENSSSSCESLLQVVRPCLIKEENSCSPTFQYIKEDLSQNSILSNSHGKITAPTEETKQRYCNHQNEVRKITFKENDITTITEMHPLSVTQNVGQTIKHMDSDSECSSESTSSPKDLSRKEQDVPVESDDTSYARAIRNFRQRALVNGMSSSCDEDFEQLNLGSFRKG
ncbi:gamma-aminobutyric acid type B receptor subunit 2-like, partial [Limulus polyphemus]|uniref:Gamma-aminobutyric acid type B receptor subunit 2-like n=1 Tax=Limulus polyphemus TaxID=6850 RepID=A0ABM1TRS1_LIMPO